MWHQSNYTAPSTPTKPLALQSLDHSQLYLRRKESSTIHLTDEQTESSEDVSNTSPNLGDYEDLSEQDWTDDPNSTNYVLPSSPRPKSFRVSFSNVAPALPPRSSSLMKPHPSLESNDSVR